ncbi:hypothetical protein OKW35_006885 [Paraburkholderia sp. MM5477-R1]
MNGDEVESVLAVVEDAWKATCADYDSRTLNSERCLQAAFYFHLRSNLNQHIGYVIFVEATVTLPKTAEDENASFSAKGGKRIAIDTLVCKDDRILIAIELKYAPRGFPGGDGIRKDLLSLSRIRNHSAKAKRVEIEIARHHETNSGNRLVLTISPHAKMLLGIFCRAPRQPRQAEEFWNLYRPSEGPWSGRVRGAPPRLGLCFGYAPEPGTSKPAMVHFVGQPFGATDLCPAVRPAANR